MLRLATPRLNLSLSLTVMTFLVLSGCSKHQSVSQPRDMTSDAKDHYQTAALAIEKGDWQTAQNELLESVALAPDNALVHYDLALAFSHNE
jgi:Tfp pilus assembly protein PilF